MVTGMLGEFVGKKKKKKSRKFKEKNVMLSIYF